MEIIDQSSSGSIPKREFQEALAKVVKENSRDDLDINSIVNDVYERNLKLTRQNIRLALNLNPEIISVNQSEPIEEQVLR